MSAHQPIKLGVVMDPITEIHYKKDSTLAMLWEASRRGYELFYLEPRDLFFKNEKVFASARSLLVHEDEHQWYTFQAEVTLPLSQLDMVLMRKDPPVDEAYLYATHLLEQVAQSGVLVMNHPQALRDFNEKLATTHFPDCIPGTLVTQSIKQLMAFLAEEKDIVCKPLNAMGGASIFHLQSTEVNARVIFELLTKHESIPIIVQRYIPAIREGDKRIIMIDGEPIAYALARVPHESDWRGNLAAGATPIVKPLTERDREICARVAPLLKSRGLLFVGLDVIGDYLTEINVTSPTGIREIEAAQPIGITRQLFDVLEKKRQSL